MKKKKNIEIPFENYGSIIVPTSWDELTLKQFQDVMKCYKKETPDIMDIIAVLTNVNKETLNSMPVSFIKTIMTHLTFLNTELEINKTSNSIVINDEVYSINPENELKFGEYTDFNTIMEADKYNYAGMLAVLCRKKNEIYNDEFSQTLLPLRMQMFEQQSVKDIYPLIGFFLQLFENSNQCLEFYLTQLRYQVNQLLQNTESLLQGGAFKKLYLTSQVMKLKKLKKSLKCI